MIIFFSVSKNAYYTINIYFILKDTIGRKYIHTTTTANLFPTNDMSISYSSMTFDISAIHPIHSLSLTYTHNTYKRTTNEFSMSRHSNEIKACVSILFLDIDVYNRSKFELINKIWKWSGKFGYSNWYPIHVQIWPRIRIRFV